jgi:hypothetical protein
VSFVVNFFGDEMKKIPQAVAYILLVSALGVSSEAQSPVRKDGGPVRQDVAQILEQKVRAFLAGASKNDPAAHDSFWADDLIYTGSSGAVKSKQDIMKSVREANAQPAKDDDKSTYDAEDVKVHDYGDFAVVNFRLVQHAQENGKPVTNYYRNTGTFRRDGAQEWHVIAWQATKVAPEQKAATK